MVRAGALKVSVPVDQPTATAQKASASLTGPRKASGSLTSPSPRSLSRSLSHIKLYGFVDDMPAPGPRSDPISEDAEEADGGAQNTVEPTWSDEDARDASSVWSTLLAYLASLPFRESVQPHPAGASAPGGAWHR